MLHPISYSFPAERMVPYISFKKDHMANHQYQFTNENEYLEHYRTALFGKTTKRAGWDCMRHYEILSQGTIPYFPNLEKLPPKTMVNFPKQLVLDLNTKYYSKTLDEIYRESSSIVYNDLNELLNYTKENLTTEKSVETILETMNLNSSNNILLVTNLMANQSDYLLSMLTHGLKMKTKGRCICYPDFDYHYQDYPQAEVSKLYGRGFNYTRLLPENYKNDTKEESIEKKLETREFDGVILYMDEATDNQVPFLIAKNYRDKTSVVCGRDCDPFFNPDGKFWTSRDYHDCTLKILSNLQNVFVRELAYD